jgi:hypothetical protein
MSRLCIFILLIGVLAPAAAAQDAPPPPEPDPPSLFEEPGLMTSALDLAARFMSRSGNAPGDDGFYPKIGGMISGAGWISGGPGYRRGLFGDRAQADAHATVSWRGYLKADASLEFPLLAGGRLLAGTEAVWQDSTQVNYFGVGPDVLDEQRTQYRLQTMNIVGYARYRSTPALAISGRLGWLDGPSIQSATGPFRPDVPDTQTTFPDDPAMALGAQPDFLHGETAVTFDTRDYPDHPTRGGLARGSFAWYQADVNRFAFRRWEAEGLQAFPLFDRGWVTVVRGWGAFSNTSHDQEVPFYLLPSLGGGDSLRGYSNYRFHDRHLLLASAESRVALLPRVDAVVFVDSGGVAPRVEDLDFSRTVYGFGFRLHSHTGTTARVDVAHNDEGWHVLYRSSDPLSLSRLKEWIAAVPFMP